MSLGPNSALLIPLNHPIVHSVKRSLKTKLFFTMMTTTADPTLFDDSAFSDNTVTLCETAVAWAIEMQKDIVDLETQWQTFIRALAVAGFEQWLNEGAVDWGSFCVRSHPPAKGINFKVNGYRLSILPTGTLSEGAVEVVVSHAQSAHLYILIEVQEEANQIQLIGGLRHDQLQPLLSNAASTTSSNGEQVLHVPVAYFTASPEQILLQLSCLTPAETTESAAHVNSAAPATNALPTQAISTNVINVRQWLQNRVETLSEHLSWVLLPPVSLAAEMRPVRTPVERILETLSLQGIRLPAQAGGATSPVRIGQLTCQLYAWAWPVESSETPEWSLFLLLGPCESAALPIGTTLQVSDCEGTLAQARLSDTSASSYLYTQVQGTWPERFWARIILPNGSEAMLPAFCFEAD